MKIKHRLLLSFSLATVLPLLLISMAILVNLQNMWTEQLFQSLDSSATAKAKAIASFYRNLESDIVIAQDYFNIKNNLPILIRLQNNKNSPEYLLAKKTLDSQMRTLQKVKGFSDMMLTDLDGNIMYATNPLHEEIDKNRNIREFGDALQNFDPGKIFVSDIFRNKIPKKDYDHGIIAYGPARDLIGNQIGGIIFEVDAQLLYNILEENFLPGATWETIIGEKISDTEIAYLSPLRKSSEYVKNTILSIKDNPTAPMVLALQGKNSGSSMTRDYAGDEVMAYWIYIPSRNWSLVVKIDAAEALLFITTIKYIIFGSLLVLFMIIGLVALRVSKSISDPLENLSHGADIIAGGNLDYRVGKNTKDEIGQLSRAFDHMTSELRNANESLNEKVKSRTKELAAKIDELEKMNSLMVGRELKMAELKKENESLRNQLAKK